MYSLFQDFSMTSLRLAFEWIVLTGLLMGLVATLASCDSATAPPEIDDEVGQADNFRPTGKPASAIADSLDVVSGGGVTRTFPVEAIANAPEAGGEGVLQVSRVDSVAARAPPRPKAAARRSSTALLPAPSRRRPPSRSPTRSPLARRSTTRPN